MAAELKKEIELEIRAQPSFSTLSVTPKLSVNAQAEEG
jgi:hypothetical protein